MKSSQVFVTFFAVLLSFALIYGDDLVGHEFEVSENEEYFDQFVAQGDIDTVWGSINNDSVRVGIPFGYSMNLTVGTIAAWNVTYFAPRIMDGIRLRSLDNTGAVGDIIDGGIGYDWAKFMLVGHSHHFRFLIDAYENYTSSLLTTSTATPPVPDIIFKEWGVINYASKQFDATRQFVQWDNPGVISEYIHKVNTSKIIDGIRLTSRNNTVASAEILEGGIGFDYFKFRVIGNREFLDFIFNTFENGTNLETRERVYGTITNNTKLHENRYTQFPATGTYATGNMTFSTNGIILGMRITHLGFFDGVYDISNGGLNTSSVTIDFRGPYPGEPYDFNVEIFGNSMAVTLKVSITLVAMLILLFNLLR
ncbi:uncharacterized protein [Chironomus tepperi]|uniref:uncharacterized protein n=1 Tax=Chironomus tepperi TaxID=113505 RepID=UPI00391F048D